MFVEGRADISGYFWRVELIFMEGDLCLWREG